MKCSTSSSGEMWFVCDSTRCTLYFNEIFHKQDIGSSSKMNFTKFNDENSAPQFKY